MLKLLAGLLLFVSFSLGAEPLYVAKADNVIIILYKEECKEDGVTNLKRRATWEENGKVTEGCWGAVSQFGIVLMWFADKTVTLLPAPFFEKVSGT